MIVTAGLPQSLRDRLARLDLGANQIEKMSATIAASFDPDGAWIRLTPILESDPTLAESPALDQIIPVVSASRALASALANNPHLLDRRAASETYAARFRGGLVAIAGEDLTGVAGLEESTSRLTGLVDEIVAAATRQATGEVARENPLAGEIPFAVMAMGKWAAGELNYYSDIDLLFVHEPLPGREDDSRAAAIAVSSRLIAILSSPAFDGAALNVDADLRPEGAMGPLSRSLQSYKSYYRRWAEAWELQALLKVRAVAGHRDLGRRFVELATEVVWGEGVTPEALRNIRNLKSRAENRADRTDLKRFRGGIRDVEFTVQLLQLVHGRFDEDLRVMGTLPAIRRLAAHGYVEEDDAVRLMAGYTFLRALEHRIQLWDLRQTHRLPRDEASLKRLGRSMGFWGPRPAEELTKQLAVVRANVREAHERLYFRPLLESLAGVPNATLDSRDAARRLEALGFRNPIGARHAVESMTAGLSRRSRVMQQALPLMLDWLSRSPDPDLGIDQLRRLMANTSDHSTLVRLLQSNPVAGERLCLLLGTGTVLGELIDRIPEYAPRLADDELIRDIRNVEGATARLRGLLQSRTETEDRIGTIRRFVRRRKLRIATRDVLGEAEPVATLRSLSDTADAAMNGALFATGHQNAGFAVVALGKWGGRELSYGSDLDLMYVYDDSEDRDLALELTSRLSRILSEPSRHGPAYQLDPKLRPEGRGGPMARSMSGFTRYYSETIEPWERLALVKARPGFGGSDLTERFNDLLDSTIWAEPPTAAMVADIRSMKARVESERIPAGEDPDFHLKLGPGGLTDVEFVVQLLQLQNGPAIESVRVPGTLEALDALKRASIVDHLDFTALYNAYLFCTRIRLRMHLQTGRLANSLPTDLESISRLASSLGIERASELREQYKRYTRRARRSFKKLFYD